MTSEASLPADDETEDAETPIARVLKAAEAAEKPEKPVKDDAPEAATAEEQPDAPEAVVDEAPAESPPADEPVIEHPAVDEGTTDAVAGWTEALRSVERSINEAADAIRFLRATMQQMAPLWRSLGGLETALHGLEEPAPQAFDDAPVPSEPATRTREWSLQQRKPAALERRWQETESAWSPPAGPPRPSLKPVTLVPDDTPAPYAYRVTVEDRKSPVELTELHRAFTSIPSVRNLSLLNYQNGVASLSLETTDEIQPLELENAVKKIMKRSCSVVPHESNVILMQMGD